MPRKLRKHEIDLGRHSTYHVVTRCVRQLHLLGGCDQSREKRKSIFLSQLKRLSRFTAIGVGGFSVMDNHLHLLLKVDVKMARGWSYREVAERWFALHPPRNSSLRVVELEESHVAAFCADAERVEACREKLMSISQFMKELKQETTQQLNKLDNTVGSVWAGRFKCKHVKDEAQLLATLAYIDLNPFAAGICELPEQGRHTSLDARLNGDPVQETLPEAERVQDEQAVAAKPRKPLAATGYERRGWWLSIGQPSDDQVAAGGAMRSLFPRSGRGLTFARYLKLLDLTSRLLRKGKKSLKTAEKQIGDRLSQEAQSVAEMIQGWLKDGIRWAGIEPVT